MKPSSPRGFTLLEMLVGLALLGLMSLALFAALRLGLQSWDRAEIKSGQVVDLRIVEGILRREIAKAFPLRMGLINENKIAFEGDSGSVHFVTALPSGLTAGGLSLVSLELADDKNNARPGEQWTQDTRKQGKALVLKRAIPDAEARDFSALDSGDMSILVRGIEEASFAFYGQDSDLDEPSWRDQWSMAARTPALLRMKFKFVDSKEQREILWQLRLGEEAGCFQSSFQRVCGARR